MNLKHPYNTRINELKKLEDSYLKLYPNPKVKVLTNTELSPYNNLFMDLFNKSDNYPKMAEAMMHKYWAHYSLYKRGGMTDDGAAKQAVEECNSLLKKLDPLTIGLTDNNRYMSKNDEFLYFLIDKANKQKLNITHYTDVLKKTRLKYNEKIDKFEKAYQYYYRTQDSLKFDEFKKYWKGIKPSTWDNLGIKFENGKLELDLEEEIKKALSKLK